MDFLYNTKEGVPKITKARDPIPDQLPRLADFTENSRSADRGLAQFSDFDSTIRAWHEWCYLREAVRHAINNLMLKMFIELEPSLYDPSNLLFDSNVLSKVLAPIFERRPAQCIHRDDSLGDGDYGSRC